MATGRNRRNNTNPEKENEMPESEVQIIPEAVIPETVQEPENENENVQPESETKTEEVTNPNLSGDVNDALYGALIAEITRYANEHNSLVSEIQAHGDRIALMDSLKERPEQTNDSEFVSIVKRYYELSDALEEAAKALESKAQPFIENALRNSGVETKQAKADEFAKKVKATILFLNTMNADVSKIPVLTGKKSATSGKGDGRGAGVPKLRNLNVIVNGKPAEEKVPVKIDGKPTHIMKSNLTFGAKAAGVTTETLRDKFYEAQGTKDPTAFKDRVEFTIKDGKGAEHNIVVVKAAE